MESVETVTSYLCPNCGKWYPILIERTGWCIKCSRSKPRAKVGDEVICVGCKLPFRFVGHYKCNACRYSDKLKKTKVCIRCGKLYSNTGGKKGYCPECRFRSCTFCNSIIRRYPGSDIAIPACVKCMPQRKKTERLLKQYDISLEQAVRWVRNTYKVPESWKERK